MKTNFLKTFFISLFVLCVAIELLLSYLVFTGEVAAKSFILISASLTCSMIAFLLGYKKASRVVKS